MMEPVPSSVTKRYPTRGPLQQWRFAEATAFACFRCGRTKRSKLISVYMDDWSRRLCNGCYGRLLSLFNIKSGTRPEDERARELADALLSTVSLDDQRQAERMIGPPRSGRSICLRRPYGLLRRRNTWRDNSHRNRSFRNRAAHTDELGSDDYCRCRDL